MMKLHIENMTCGSCAKHVTTTVLSIDPAAIVNIDLPTKTVEIESKKSAELFISALKEEEYLATLIN